MVITKQIAQDAAKLACKKLQDQINNKKIEIYEFIEKTHMDNLPRFVKDAFERKDPIMSFVNKVCYSYVSGEGITGSTNRFSLPKELPVASKSSSISIHLSGVEAAVYVRLKNELDSLETKHKLMVEKLENVLLNMRTYKNVCEQMPEMVGFIKKPEQKTKLIVPLDTIRKEMNELNIP